MSYIGDKHDRKLAIFYNLLEGVPVSVKSAAEYYGVSTKTVQRDIDDIRNVLSENAYATGDKKWHSKDKYKCNIYQCNSKFKNSEKCKTPNLTEEEIQNIFIEAYNIAMKDKTRVLEDCALMIETVCDCTELDEKIETLNEELNVVSELVSQCVNENAQKKQSQEAYNKKYNSLVRRYEKAEKRLKAVTAERTERTNKEREMQIFIETLRDKPESITDFDRKLWVTLVEKVEVSHDKKRKVHFKNGVTVQIAMMK